ncbi:MAG TPA: GntR family transcriptional regulator [Baekduia sp.]
MSHLENRRRTALSAGTHRPLTKTDAAAAALRSAIEDGRYEPGQHLPINLLIADLDMSPTPIREALRMLQAEGLLVGRPHRGVVVADTLPEQLDEVYQLRQVLEPLATEWATEHASDEQLAEIRDLHERLRKLIVDHPDDEEEAAALNEQWHQAIYRATGSRHLPDFIERLWLAMPLNASWFAKERASSVQQHGEVVDAMEARDAAKAAELMRTHVRHGGDTTMRNVRASRG